MQTIIYPNNHYRKLDEYLLSKAVKGIFLVCSKSIWKLKIGEYFLCLESRFGIKITVFEKFEPNPTYDSVVEAVKLFDKSHCDMIVAIGGGSAIDVAKCIKLFCNMPDNEVYFKQEIIPNNIPFLAIPTTAGTGSEATRFAVIYYNGEKQSITHTSCIPSAVLFDSATLKTLPLYQRQSTMLDALCHAIESYWSVNATTESRDYAKKAIDLIMKNSQSYLKNENFGNNKMLTAANLAGKAINISQTTAGHALSYKLTSLTKISHGHAVAIVLPEIWRYMLDVVNKYDEGPEKDRLNNIFLDLAQIFGEKTATAGLKRFENFIASLNMQKPHINDENQLNLLADSVNAERLKNNPIQLSKEAILKIYRNVLKEE